MRDPVARCAVLVAGIAPLCTGRRSYIPQFKGTAMPEVAGLALYGAAASRAAVVAFIGAVSAVSRFGVIAFAAMARVCGCRVGRAVVVQRLQWTGMTGVCRWVDIRTGTDDMAAVCAGGVAGVALTVADLRLRIEHRGAAAVVTACIDRLKEETAAAGGTHGAELWDRAAPLEGGAVGHQIEQGLRLIGIPISSNRYDIILIVFAAILHLPADGFLTGSLLGIKPDLVAGLDDHTGCPAIFHRHKSGVLCPLIGSSVIILVDFCLCVLANAAFSLHAASAALGIGVFDHIPAAPAVGNHDELLAAGYFAFFRVGIVRFNDELLHRLGRAADVEGILIDTVEAGAVPVPAVIMDMALHRNDIVADGTSEHIDSAAAHCVIANVKHKGMREDALLGAGGHIMRFVIACFKQARELVAVAFRVAAHDTVMGNPMLIDPSDIVFRRSLAVFRGHTHTRLLMAVGMGGSQLCLRRFHGVRRVALSADDAVVGVVIHAGLGGNRQPQRWGVHVHIVICLRQLVGRRRGIRIILLIPLIGQLVAFQALCRDREGDPVMFAVQQVVFRLFVIIAAAVDRGLTLDAPRLAVDDDGTAADVVADLAHAIGVKFMVGGIQLFIVTIAAGVPVLRSVSRPAGGGYVGMSGAGMLRLQMILKIRVAEAPVVMIAAHSAYGISAAVLAALIAAVLGVISAALQTQAAVLAGLLVQQAFLALFAGRVAIDAVDDAGIIVVHALVHRTEAGVTQRAVHRVAVIVCAVIAESAGVADGYGAAGTLMAFAAQLVILADVAFATGGAVRVLHAVGAFIARLAPIGRVSKAHTAVVTMGFNPALVVTVNGAEQAVTHILAAKMVVVAVRTIEAVVVVVPKGMGGKLQTRHQ